MFDAVAACLVRLRRRYAEPHRAYHNQAHVAAMLADLAEVRAELAGAEAVELAIWFHDAIYDPAAADNETRSAALLLHELAGLADASLLDRAATLIRATADHAIPPGLPPEVAADMAVFLDLDMAVLGAAPGAYDAYERGIAAEFVPVHGAAPFAAGRARFLADMLARPRLFQTERAVRRLDGAARANIGRALASLRCGDPIGAGKVAGGS